MKNKNKVKTKNMSTFFRITNALVGCANKQQTRCRASNYVFFGNIFLACLIILLAVGYLIEINSLATKGYQIKELEKELTLKSQEKSELEQIALNLQSMGEIKRRVEGMGMVAINNAEYLAIDKPVAVAR